MSVKGDSKERQSRELGFFFDVGIQFGLSIIIGFFAGWWIDKKAGTTPLFLLSGIGFGAVAGFYNLYRQVMAHNRRKKSE